MHRFPRAWSLLVAASLAAALLADCQGLGSATASSVPNPTPTPTGSPTSSPGPCATMDANNANLVVVAMAGGISPITVPGYPTVFGYGVSDVNLDLPSQSQLINITAFGGTTPITTQNTVQFFNAEAARLDDASFSLRFQVPRRLSIAIRISVTRAVADGDNDCQ